jgi:hypothetical protein
MPRPAARQAPRPPAASAAPAPAGARSPRPPRLAAPAAAPARSAGWRPPPGRRHGGNWRVQAQRLGREQAGDEWPQQQGQQLRQRATAQQGQRGAGQRGARAGSSARAARRPSMRAASRATGPKIRGFPRSLGATRIIPIAGGASSCPPDRDTWTSPAAAAPRQDKTTDRRAPRQSWPRCAPSAQARTGTVAFPNDFKPGHRARLLSQQYGETPNEKERSTPTSPRRGPPAWPAA